MEYPLGERGSPPSDLEFVRVEIDTILTEMAKSYDAQF